MKEIFDKHPEVLAVIGIKDGAAFLDSCDERVSVTELMVLINKFTQEYLQAIAVQSQTKENSDG
jgi:hypothetical protein